MQRDKEVGALTPVPLHTAWSAKALQKATESSASKARKMDSTVLAFSTKAMWVGSGVEQAAHPTATPRIRMSDFMLPNYNCVASLCAQNDTAP